MSFAQISAILEPINHQRKIIGFDTFGGFEGVGQNDVTGRSEHSHDGGMGVDSKADLERSIELFDDNRHLNHIPKVELVKGDAVETVPQYIEDNPHTVISLLYLDMDIYNPTKAALDTLVPRIPKGGIIAFDQLNSGNWPGETLAVLDSVGISNLRIQRCTFDTCVSFAVVE